ncbi:MAG TPA: DUF763 domain-containing protein [Kiritimatiellia bacterium]|nr:DUF763 domain-containing protein [Kiritimatiellia bacterium]
MRSGYATLPLHNGRAPEWLTRRMARLGRAVVEVMVTEFGTRHFLERLSDPFWFQAFGCALGFDWHSSGVTTTVCGALKEGLQDAGPSIGIFVCGGKGGRSRKTPDEIAHFCEGIGTDPVPLAHASRMSAKIDSAAVQDGYQLYHHSFFFERDGHWSVVQQGMADERDPLGAAHRGMARRYHWMGSRVNSWDVDPHAAICCDARGQLALNLVAAEGAANRDAAVRVFDLPADSLLREVRRLPELRMDRRHQVLLSDVHPDRIQTILLQTYDRPPSSFLDLLGRPKVGAKTMRALSLIGEIVYGASPSFTDPARFSFAHGGKDGTPYPVDRTVYGETIETLREILDSSGIDRQEKLSGLKRLAKFERAVGHTDRQMQRDAYQASAPVTNATSSSTQSPTSRNE